MITACWAWADAVRLARHNTVVTGHRHRVVKRHGFWYIERALAGRCLNCGEPCGRTFTDCASLDLVAP